MGNPYCSGTILVLKPVKWGKLFSKVHFLRYSHFLKSTFSAIPMFNLVFLVMLEVFFDRKWLSSGTYSIFCVKTIRNCTFQVWNNIFIKKYVYLLHLLTFSHFQKKRTIVKLSRTIGGFEIFQNRTIVKYVLIETVLSGDSLYKLTL